MCLMAFAWQVGEYPLTLLGNRDEFHARPTHEAGFWVEEKLPDLLAGKDLDAGGTWLGVTRSQRFAALTNIRAPIAKAAPRSRGGLALNYLASDIAPGEYLEQLVAEADEYGGFNLIIGDAQQLWYFNSHDKQAILVSPGIYGLSNGNLDSDWPKQRCLRDGLAADPDGKPVELLELLANNRIYPDAELPDTGIRLELERALSAAFIIGKEYGTRASTFVRLGREGEIEFLERRYGSMGVMLGESSWQLD
ncbi:NRDE family protein [Halopseudomonas salina]|uniref:NRDE family protein n=1 Tax=Halopseudomonas salina TaxID=1323744 RepID=A0ABQ1PX23_9GAMM|nr:NRDE family protein [Halopseudomonas salina]GGD06255.1 hypothetical protein GCM10007418_26600 [Halopseudomonas salina]